MYNENLLNTTMSIHYRYMKCKTTVLLNMYMYTIVSTKQYFKRA